METAAERANARAGTWRRNRYLTLGRRIAGEVVAFLHILS